MDRQPRRRSPSFLITGALDLANLAIALINGGRYGGQQFLSPESVAEMQTPVTTIPNSGVYRDPSNLDPESGVRLRCDNGKLLIGGDGEEEACVPIGPNAYLNTLGLLEFVTDGSSMTLVIGYATSYERTGEGIVAETIEATR